MSENVLFFLLIAGAVLFEALVVLAVVLWRKRRGMGPQPRPVSVRMPETDAAGIDKEALSQIMARVKENTQCDRVCIDLKPEPAPSLFSSKVGGYPYWDLSMPYPTDDQGEKLALLAQINMAELPENERFPRKGILQFFILPDDLYGMSYQKHDDQNGFRVIWHETVDRGVTEAEVRALELPTSFTCEEGLPHRGEFAMGFCLEKDWMGMEDFRFDDELRRAADELGLDLPETVSAYSVYRAFGKELDSMPWMTTHAGSHLLGYPYFVQEDPRSKDSPYDTLLFQLDSYFAARTHPESAEERSVLWGDAGVGNFFIRSEDLQAKRFDRVYYTWDCG